MPKKTLRRARMRIVRHRRVRKKIRGTSAMPRLSVFRSLKHIYEQVIDDTTGTTLVAMSTEAPEVRDRLEAGMNRIAQSKVVGQALGTRAKEQGISQIAFDRGGYLYHGRVKALAEGARESGLEF